MIEALKWAFAAIIVITGVVWGPVISLLMWCYEILTNPYGMIKEFKEDMFDAQDDN